MSNDRITERQVTTELEHGDASHVPSLFAGKFEEERLASLREMKRLYDEDRKTGATKADVDFNAQAYYNPAITISVNGNRVYNDGLDPAKLTHTTANDIVPQDRAPIDQAKLRQVTTDLENGHPESLKGALDGKFLEERARFLHAVEDLNHSDLKERKTWVELSVQYAGHKWFGDEMSVHRYAPGGIFSSNFWGNPHTPYNEKLNMSTGERTYNLHADTRQ